MPAIAQPFRWRFLKTNELPLHDLAGRFVDQLNLDATGVAFGAFTEPFDKLVRTHRVCAKARLESECIGEQPPRSFKIPR